MNTQTNITQNEVENEIIITPGQQLRKAREAKKLTPEEISKQLFLNKEIIYGLENDDYSKMVAPVYVRGYLIAYARLMQIPSETILKGFEKMVPLSETTKTAEQTPMKVLHPFKINPNQEQSGSSWAIYTTIAILIIAASVWMYNHNRNSVLQEVSSGKNIESTQSNTEPHDNSMSYYNSSGKLTEQENLVDPPLSPITGDTQKALQTTSNIAISPDNQ